MLRGDNATDFWRGYALVTIFINHIPGNFYFQFTHRNFGLSDSAELFVFLAGLGLHHSISKPALLDSSRLLLWHLGRRAFKIYAAQMVIISLAVAMLAGASIALETPLITSWNNSEATFYDPVRANVGFALLSYHIGYFDILPLYVALTLAAPILVMTARVVPWTVLPASLALYVLALAFELNLPTWPVDGQWFFNPLTWQLTFILGFLYGRGGRAVELLNRHIVGVRVLAAAIVIVSVMAKWMSWLPDPTAAPEPRLFFIDYKTFETPVRIVHFLALAALLSSTFPYIARVVPPLTRTLCLLGRNSLNVFCLGSLLSLAGQIVRFAAGGTVPVDTLMILAGVLTMIGAARLAEWPQTSGRIRA